MQQLPASDPRSWDYQPAIHRAYLTKRPSGAPWGTGQNATWFFLPWHRMYLFAFENIVRSLLPEAERADWALPFWDYSSGAPANTLPPAFRVPTLPDAMRNPLFVPARRASVNSGAALPSTVTDVATALAETHFTATDLGASVGFGGPRTGFARHPPAFGGIQARPDGPVHVQVGGAAGLMSDPNSAAQDPICWLHRANIDRLWEVWNIGGGANPTERAWLDRPFRVRIADGSSTRMTARGVLDTVTQLDYTYESLPVNTGVRKRPPRAPKLGRPLLIGINHGPVQIGRRGATAHLAVTPVPEQTTGAGPGRLHLHLTDIDGSTNPGVVFGVYLDLPDDLLVTGLSDNHSGCLSDSSFDPARVDRRADHLVGVIAFFGIQDTDPAIAAASRREPEGMRYSFDITDLADRLRARDQWRTDALTVTLLPVAPDDEPESLATDGTAPIRVGTFSLYQG